MYRVDNRSFSLFIALLALALAETVNLFGLLPTTNHSMMICLFYVLLKPPAFINVSWQVKGLPSPKSLIQ